MRRANETICYRHLRVEYLPIDALCPADRRVRKSTASQNAKVELSLRQFGICAPILIDADGRIVHGHIVWEAARRLGLEKIPVVRIDHLNQTERRALAIALNRIGETGEWDVEALKIEFEELIELNEEIFATGFELAEVDALLLEDDSEEPEAEEALPLPESQVSQLGDLWLMGEHRLLQGDARDREVYARLVTEGEGVRLALTDVPFNVPIRGHCTGQAHHREFELAHGELSREEFDAFNKDWMRLASDVLVDGGLLATFIDWRSVDLILSAGRELGLDLLNSSSGRSRTPARAAYGVPSTRCFRSSRPRRPPPLLHRSSRSGALMSARRAKSEVSQELANLAALDLDVLRRRCRGLTGRPAPEQLPRHLLIGSSRTVSKRIPSAISTARASSSCASLASSVTTGKPAQASRHWRAFTSPLAALGHWRPEPLSAANMAAPCTTSWCCRMASRGTVRPIGASPRSPTLSPAPDGMVRGSLV